MIENVSQFYNGDNFKNAIADTIDTNVSYIKMIVRQKWTEN